MANVTFLGDLADWWDVQKNETFAICDFAVEKSGYNLLAIISAVIVKTYVTVGEGVVNLLRLGNGVSKGTKTGVLEDGLRLLSVAGPTARVVGKFASQVRLLRVVQKAGTLNCVWVTASNAMRYSGRYFMPLRSLFRTAGLGRHEQAWVTKVLATDVTKYNILLKAIKNNLRINLIKHEVKTLDELVDLVGKKKSGSYIYGVLYGDEAASFGHAMFAIYKKGKVAFVDTNGAVYLGLKALRKVYKNAKLAEEFVVAEVPKSTVITLTNVAGTVAAKEMAVDIVFPVRILSKKEHSPNYWLRQSSKYHHWQH